MLDLIEGEPAARRRIVIVRGNLDASQLVWHSTETSTLNYRVCKELVDGRGMKSYLSEAIISEYKRVHTNNKPYHLVMRSYHGKKAEVASIPLKQLQFHRC